MQASLRVAALCAAILGMGCSKQNPETASVPAQAGAPKASIRRSENLITSDELSGSTAQNVFQAVQVLRPGWLRSRARTSLGAGGSADGLWVYMDNTRYGGIDALRQLPLTGIIEIRYLDPAEATTRFGTGHTLGAIVIRMTRAGSM